MVVRWSVRVVDGGGFTGVLPDDNDNAATCVAFSDDWPWTVFVVGCNVKLLDVTMWPIVT